MLLGPRVISVLKNDSLSCVSSPHPIPFFPFQISKSPKKRTWAYMDPSVLLDMGRGLLVVLSENIVWEHAEKRSIANRSCNNMRSDQHGSRRFLHRTLLLFLVLFQPTWTILEKLTVAQLLTKFPNFYGTQTLLECFHLLTTGSHTLQSKSSHF